MDCESFYPVGVGAWFLWMVLCYLLPNRQMTNGYTRVRILNTIFDHFQQMTQWLVNHSANVTEYANKAESLIEVLEVIDCGSVGGYDKKNPLKHITKFDLYNRFLTLVHKYDDEKHIAESCGFTLESMGKYFNIAVSLRETILNGEPVEVSEVSEGGC